MTSFFFIGWTAAPYLHRLKYSGEAGVEVDVNSIVFPIFDRFCRCPTLSSSCSPSSKASNMGGALCCARGGVPFADAVQQVKKFNLICLARNTLINLFLMQVSVRTAMQTEPEETSGRPSNLGMV
jgi:hypothetical protein